MGRVTDQERREVARRLRDMRLNPWDDAACEIAQCAGIVCCNSECHGSNENPECAMTLCDRLADLIEPSYKPDAEYETWYNGLSHVGDERGGPSTIHELIEEIVWTALTVDLGPNGNTDSICVDEGRVYTDRLFAEWDREALRLSGGIDRDALLALVDELERPMRDGGYSKGIARRIREALGVQNA